MNIAQIAPSYEAVPPKRCGGTHRSVAARTKARLVAPRDHPIRLDAAAIESDLTARLSLLKKAKRRVSRFAIRERLSA